MKEETDWEKKLRQIRKQHVMETLSTSTAKLIDSLFDSMLLSHKLDKAATYFQKNYQKDKDWYRIDTYRGNSIALQTYISLINPEKKWTSCYSGEMKKVGDKKEDWEFKKREIWIVNPEKYKEWATEMVKGKPNRGFEIPGMTSQIENGKATIVFHRH